MKTWIRTVVLWAWGIGAGSSVLAQPAPAALSAGTPDAVVLTAEELAQAGAARLSDLFALLDDWYAYSREGYSFSASARGLAPTEQPAWQVFVDGQPVGLSILGSHHLNTLPLHLNQVDSVEVLSMPALVHGVFAPGGVLHLHTRRPRRGLTAGGSFAAGNEINDPGPYRYTSEATPNIDRIGPVYTATLGFAAPRWHLQAGLKADEQHATHPEIADRVRVLYRVYGQPPARIRLLAPSLTAGTTAAGTHRLVAGFSRLEDFRYFAPFGLEVPTEQSFAYLGLSGDVAPGRPAGVRYRASYNARGLGFRTHRDSLDFDWRQVELQGNLEGYLNRPRFDGRLGVSFQQIESRAAYALDDSLLSFISAYSAVEARFSRFWTQGAVFYLTKHGARLGFKALTTASLYAGHGLSFSVRLAYARQAVEEQNSLWYWIAQGYGFPAEHGGPVVLPEAFEHSTLASADALGSFRPAPRLGISLFGFARQYGGLTLPTYDPVTDAYYNVTTVHTGVEGRVLGGGLRLRWQALPVLEQRLQVTLTRPVTEPQSVFRESWANQPLYRLGYTARFLPNERFSVYARLRYQSGTRWPQYLRHGARPLQAYDARRPALVLVDLTVQKRLWRDNLRGSLSLRNAFNAPYLAEPAGIRTFLTLFVQFQALLNTNR